MNRSELIKTLEVVSRGLTNNNIAPAFGYFCFTGESVFSWNDNFAIVGECKVDKPFGVHGKTLLGLLNNCSSEEVEIKVDEDHVLITSGSSDFKLPYITEKEFLWNEPDILKPDQVWYSLDEIRHGVELCLKSSSDDVALGAFNQICIGGNMIMYSCDGDTITRVEPRESHKYEPTCLSKSFVDVVSKIADWGKCEFCTTDEWAVVEGEFTIWGRNLGPPQLDYEAEIRKSVGVNDYKFVPISPELDGALSRARVIADAETKPTVLLVFEHGYNINTDTNSGLVCDLVEVNQDHEEIKVNISAALLQKGLEGCSEICVTEQCIILRGERILRLIANLGD